MTPLPPTYIAHLARQAVAQGRPLPLALPFAPGSPDGLQFQQDYQAELARLEGPAHA